MTPPGTHSRDHAKLLWQRIPSEVKDSSPELKDLWEIGKKLWKREFAAVYSLAQSPSWPPHLEPIVTSLIGKYTSYQLSRDFFSSNHTLWNHYKVHPAIVPSPLTNTPLALHVPWLYLLLPTPRYGWSIFKLLLLWCESITASSCIQCPL